MPDRNFFAELKRRNVYKVAVAYAVAAWLLIQVATQVFPFFDIPNWSVRLVILLLALGFPLALILAWAFELTPEGIKRADEVTPEESRRAGKGRKLIAFSVVVAFLAAALFALRFLHLNPAPLKAVAAVPSAVAPPPPPAIPANRSRCCLSRT